MTFQIKKCYYKHLMNIYFLSFYKYIYIYFKFLQSHSIIFLDFIFLLTQKCLIFGTGQHPVSQQFQCELTCPVLLYGRPSL